MDFMQNGNGVLESPVYNSNIMAADNQSDHQTVLLRIEKLEKQFGSLPVLQSVDVTIMPGVVTAIVGPNGSGKSTLIKSILGLVRPDRGTIWIKGQKINGDCSYRRHIGYMPQIARFPENLRVRELLYMIKDVRESEAKLDEDLRRIFALDKERDKVLRTLSGGTRQKVSAAIAFMFQPEILILDEPTAGLDPASSSKLKDKILQEKARGKTIVLTSHIMSEVEQMADDIAFLLDGQIRFTGKISALKAHAGATTLERAMAQMMEKGAE